MRLLHRDVGHGAPPPPAREPERPVAHRTVRAAGRRRGRLDHPARPRGARRRAGRGAGPSPGLDRPRGGTGRVPRVLQARADHRTDPGRTLRHRPAPHARPDGRGRGHGPQAVDVRGRPHAPRGRSRRDRRADHPPRGRRLGRLVPVASARSGHRTGRRPTSHDRRQAVRRRPRREGPGRRTPTSSSPSCGGRARRRTR